MSDLVDKKKFLAYINESLVYWKKESERSQFKDGYVAGIIHTYDILLERIEFGDFDHVYDFDSLALPYLKFQLKVCEGKIDSYVSQRDQQVPVYWKDRLSIVRDMVDELEEKVGIVNVKG